MYTAIEDLPQPCTQIMKEVEKADAEHLKELLEKVLTIKEARCIRVILLKKLNRHPFVQCFYDYKESRANNFGKDMKNCFAFSLIRGYNHANNLYNYPHINGFIKMVPNKMWRNHFELAKNKTGKNKGELNNKRKLLLESIDHYWRHFVTLQKWTAIIDGNFYEIKKDDLLRCGYARYFDYTWNRNVKRNKGDWDFKPIPIEYVNKK